MRAYLVEVEHQVELADIIEERVCRGIGQSAAEDHKLAKGGV